MRTRIAITTVLTSIAVGAAAKDLRHGGGNDDGPNHH